MLNYFMILFRDCTFEITCNVKEATRFFFITNTFVSNVRLKLAKNQVKSKQHPKAELLLFEI